MHAEMLNACIFVLAFHTMYSLFLFVDLPASRNSAETLLGYQWQADVLSISTDISLTSMIEKYGMTLYFCITG